MQGPRRKGVPRWMQEAPAGILELVNEALTQKRQKIEGQIFVLQTQIERMSDNGPRRRGRPRKTSYQLGPANAGEA
jgi:hypothetical protein